MNEVKPITKYDDEMLSIMRDPVKWAKIHLSGRNLDGNAGPRWYQEQILRHPHHKKVLRCGRRIGKCIAESQRITDADTGERISIKELVEQGRTPNVLAVDEHFKTVKASIMGIEDNGVQEVFKVSTRKGNNVTLTGNHPVLTLEGWKEIDLLEVGESIAIPKKNKIFVEEKPQWTEAELRFFAYLVAKGKKYKEFAILEVVGKDMQQMVKEAGQALGLKMFKRSLTTFYLFEVEHPVVAAFLNNPESQFIPEEVYKYDEESLIIFLASVLDVSGFSQTSAKAEMGVNSHKVEYLFELKHLLGRIGVSSYFSQRDKMTHFINELRINGALNCLTFMQIINPYSLKDYTPFIERLSAVDNRASQLPKEIWHVLDNYLTEETPTYKVLNNSFENLDRTSSVSEKKLRELAEMTKSVELYDLSHSDVIWDKVVSIESAGYEKTYDVYVPKLHNLLVEDVFVHNTWTMAAHMLWVAFTSNGGLKSDGGAKCVVATPYDNQARLIYDQLSSFIEENETLSSSIKSKSKAPYIIQFHNGSSIKLFTAGTKSGAEGGSLRGQAADSPQRFPLESTFVYDVISL